MLTVNVEAEFDLPLVGEAVELLSRAVTMSPDKLRYRHAYAEALLAARRNDEAEEQLRFLNEREPRARTSYLLAVVLRRLGRIDEAHSALDAAAEEGSVGFAKLHILRGRLYESEDRMAEAANEYGEAMILNPNSREARWQRARALVHLAQTRTDAAGLYRRAFQLLREHQPGALDEDEYHYLLGRIHLAMLHPVEALKHLERSRHPSESEKQLLVGLAFLLGGDAAGARPNLAQAAKDPDVRPSIEQFLTEISTTPLEAMANLSGHSGGLVTPNLASDIDVLTAVFGPRAPEIDRIREAARQGRRPEAIRTNVEGTDLLVGGRLLAGEDESASTVSFDDAESTVVSPAHRGGKTTRPAQVPADQLFPQTHVDVTRALARTERLEIPADDDLDEGRRDDDEKGTIRNEEFPDFDEIPDIDFDSFGEINPSPDEEPER
jgi:tetratricopeptide (TPR) repeat protein